MSIKVRISVRCDDLSDVFELQHILLYRYERVSFDIKAPSLLDDDDDDIDADDVLGVLEHTHGLIQAGLRREAEASVALDGETQSLGESRIKRVTGDDHSDEARDVKAMFAAAIGCPTCKAAKGRPCISPAGKEYGPRGFMHASRIDAGYSS